jgi:hypothetical protein
MRNYGSAKRVRRKDATSRPTYSMATLTSTAQQVIRQLRQVELHGVRADTKSRTGGCCALSNHTRRATVVGLPKIDGGG